MVEMDEGITQGVPTATIFEIDTLGEMLTGKLGDLEAIMSKKIEIKGMPQLLRWVAPFVALQNDERNKEFRKHLGEIMNKALKKHGF